MSFDPFDFKSALPVINEDSEFFPLMSSEDEEEIKKKKRSGGRRRRTRNVSSLCIILGLLLLCSLSFDYRDIKAI